jgi:dolichol-phosphate mannosyltransferase
MAAYRTQGNPPAEGARRVVVIDSTAGWGSASRSADEHRRALDNDELVIVRVARRLPEIQFVRFCAVGASGYAVNLAVYAALLEAGLHYLAAAAVAFIVAAGSNYLWNRIWTFRTSGAPVLGQGARALVVSALSLGANQLFLVVLVAAGAGHLAAQAVAIVLATPFSFAANKLWAFAEPRREVGLEPAPVTASRRNR